MTAKPVLFLIAGEPSGDLLGARLMQALRKLSGDRLEFRGIGGERMLAEGLDPFFAQSELAHMGFAELFAHLPRLLRRIRETAAEIKRVRPAALITIDSPDFCFRVARQLKGAGIPLIHYVAPSVWAWRPGRAKKIARFLDHLLALLPFEPPYFTRENLPCTFVGHSIIESGAGKGSGARYREAHHVESATPLLAVLLGSRTGEITRLASIFRETIERLKIKYPDIVCAMPTVPAQASRVRALVKDWPVRTIVTDDDASKYDAFAGANAALACSGTISLELALARLPSVIAYRINALTAALYRRLIKVRYATLTNLMADRMVVPEFLQQYCRPENLAAAVDVLLSDQNLRDAQIAELGKIAVWLGEGDMPPSERAARVVLQVTQIKRERAAA